MAVFKMLIAIVGILGLLIVAAMAIGLLCVVIGAIWDVFYVEPRQRRDKMRTLRHQQLNVIATSMSLQKDFHESQRKLEEIAKHHGVEKM